LNQPALASDVVLIPRCLRSFLINAGLAAVGKEVVVGGWVKTGRKQGKDTFVFLEVNDGSCTGMTSL